MIFSARKRLFALAIACLMLVFSCAAAAEQALVMKSAVVYADAKTSAKALGKLGAGTQLEVVAQKNGWSMVKLNGKTGFMQSNALVKYATYKNKVCYTTKATAMYQTFSTSSKKLGTIPGGDKVSVQATAGNWARVKYNGYTGFVALSNLSGKAPAAQSKTFTAYASVNNAEVYNANGKLLGKVPINTQVTVLAVKNGVCQVKRDGVVAYMKQNQLSTSKVAVKETPKTKTAYASVENATVYNANGKAVCTVPLNTQVTVLAVKNGICQVKRDGMVAYMKQNQLSATKIEVKTKTAYASVDNATVYNANGKTICTVPLNTQVTVLAVKNGICQVKRDGMIAYMKQNQLSATKIQTKDDNVTKISPTTFYVKKNDAAVVDSKGGVIAKLSINTAVTVTAYSNEYAMVTNGSTVGLMLKSDLSAEKIATSHSLSYGDKGEAVEKVQQRLKDLGYFGGTIGGNYLDLTKSAVADFQSAAGLSTNGVCDETTLTALFSDKAPKKEAPKKETPKEESASAGHTDAKPATGTAKAMDWWTSGIQSIFSRGTVATVTDVSTGIAWYTKRTGGTNHADVQPLTAADTAAMKKAVGSWSWNRRPVFVTINGVNYAASMNAMPHGSGSITNNNFSGHHCIHFTNSRTHGSNKVCSLHQAAIQKAAAATL